MSPVAKVSEFHREGNDWYKPLSLSHYLHVCVFVLYNFSSWVLSKLHSVVQFYDVGSSETLKFAALFNSSLAKSFQRFSLKRLELEFSGFARQDCQVISLLLLMM
jgi:hypothetical protein